MIQRYEEVTHDWYTSIEPDPHGDWCRWADVEAELQRMQAVVDAARKVSECPMDLEELLRRVVKIQEALAQLDAAREGKR